MSKLKKCKICKEDSGRKNVCEECKDKYPYKAAPMKDNMGIGGGKPFDRRKEYEKSI